MMTNESSQNPDTESPEPQTNLEPGQQAQRDKEEKEQQRLDEAIEMTFPASDPLAI